ncbi:MAG: HRDC domain-containing protein [bacterium]
MREAELITTAADLEQVAARLLQTEAVAVDTEFFWERTFYPILGLVQLATGDGACWLIDTVRIKDISALGPVIASPTLTKVLHDAPQDLGILARATGAWPRTIFDTRLAAGFAGFGATCSLQALLRQALNIELSKTETRSDWLRRPLSANQLRYAADDVLHLLPLREALLSRCASEPVRAWLGEDLARLDDPAAYHDRDPRLMYLRVKGGSRLNACQLSILRELADWREEEARQRDWPRGHFLPDEVLVTLALRAPADRKALADVPDMPRNMPDAVLADLLSAVVRGLSIPDAECPQPSADDFSSRRTLKSQSDRLLAHISAICAVHHIDPALVASRADTDTFVRQLAEGTVANLPLAQGWRQHFVAEFTL